MCDGTGDLVEDGVVVDRRRGVEQQLRVRAKDDPLDKSVLEEFSSVIADVGWAACVLSCSSVSISRSRR